MLKIRLKRLGKRNAPHYRIVVMPARTKRDGRAIEYLGHYNPRTKDLKIDKERAEYWLSVGAQPTDTAKSLLTKQKILKPEPRYERPARKPKKEKEEKVAKPAPKQEEKKKPEKSKQNAEKKPVEKKEEKKTVEKPKKETEKKDKVAKKEVKKDQPKEK